MNNEYVALVYAVALAVLWGYGAALWLESRAVSRRERTRAGGRP
jgi:hypothetical protein